MDIKTELSNFLGEKHNLVDAITREYRERDYTDAKTIAREVAPAFSRDQVTQYLAAITLQDKARKALKESGLDMVVDAWVTGIDAPREAHLNLAADPAETSDYASLPSRIRAVLRDFHITLDLPQGEHEEITDELVDEMLLDGAPVRLIKLQARS